MTSSSVAKHKYFTTSSNHIKPVYTMVTSRLIKECFAIETIILFKIYSDKDIFLSTTQVQKENQIIFAGA